MIVKKLDRTPFGLILNRTTNHYDFGAQHFEKSGAELWTVDGGRSLTKHSSEYRAQFVALKAACVGQASN